ncbi:O-antigen polysaccharide polymerase Wzy [Acinetobacter towneri]|uniref:O-antigen polysaccharide polymerase Wzy n=1 Tax=Acinetobacter towneri TaxID=202956 RepID=A0AAP9GXG3_9GAMM|nr:O-antigen polysaccharide polymerase Wzy [Acinetobacter towneri]QGM28720.1 O-antigen polysaccharide polymerase Wzy [Acinetobacter towneri]
MMRFILFVSMIFITIISFLLPKVLGIFSFSIYLLIINFLISFFLVNMNNLNTNLVNLQSIFLIGFLVFFLGRFVAFLLDPSLYDKLFCTDFIFNYCSSSTDINFLIFLLNLILVAFSMAFLSKVNISRDVNYLDENNIFISKTKKCLIYSLFFLSFGISFYYRLESIAMAISGGYMALYTTQAESYETPFVMLLSVSATCSLALLYSLRKKLNSKIFGVALGLYILYLLIGIMTGSRATFIGGLILLIWMIFRNRRVKKIFYIAGIGICVLIVGAVNWLAGLSGARAFSESSNSLEAVSETIYSQGITLMVFNSSIHTEGFPILGAIKTIIPGIQAIFPLFGLNNRHEFDWGSYMTFTENKNAYQDGFGLGWSIYSDFYIFSLGFLPLFYLFVYLFGRLIINVSKNSGYYNEGIVFIFVLVLFSINRGQLSPLIFSVIVYSLLCLFVGTLKVRRL